MKHIRKNWKQKWLSLFLVLSLIIPSLCVQTELPVFADSNNVSVKIRVEDSNMTLVPQTQIQASNFDLEKYGGAKTTSPRMLHALVKAMEEMGLDCTEKGTFDYASGLIKGICGKTAADTGGWMYYVNNAFITDYADKYVLQPNDNIVFFYVENWANYWFTWFGKEAETAYVGTPLTVTLTGSSFDMYTNQTKIDVIPNATVLIDDQPALLNGSPIVTDEKGQATLIFDAAKEYTLTAERKANDGKHDITRPYCKVTVLPVGVVDHTKLKETLQVAEKFIASIDSTEYPADALKVLEGAIVKAKGVVEQNSETLDGVIKTESDLSVAFDTFKNSRKFDKSHLKVAIELAQAKFDTIQLGAGVGQYPQIAKDALGKTIEAAKIVFMDATVDQNTVDLEVSTISKSMTQLNQAIIKPSLKETIEKIVTYYSGQEKVTTHFPRDIGLVGAGNNLTDKEWLSKYTRLTPADFKQPYNYSSSTALKLLAAMAQGINISAFEGRNIGLEFAALQQASGGFSLKDSANFSDQSQSMLALDAANITYNKEMAVVYLSAYQKNDGGFASYGDSGNLADTAQALLALSSHRDITDVNVKIEKAIQFIKSKQSNTGELIYNDSSNITDMAKVISGLVACGENVLDDNWVKSGNSLVDAILKNQKDDGSFFTDKNKQTTDISATAYVLIALDDIQNQNSTYKSLGKSIMTPIQGAVNWYKTTNHKTLSDWWELVALRGSGETITDGTWNLPNFDSTKLDAKTANGSNYAGVIIGMIAKGEDPLKAWENKRNLISELSSKQKNGIFEETLNDHVWAMIALDCAKATYDKDAAAKHLINQQLGDGGFVFWGTQGDPDATAMAMIALSNHKEVAGVQESINCAIAWLKTQQMDTAGFSSWGVDNSNTLAMVITGLVSVGENPLDVAWVKNGKTMESAILSFQLPDYSFAYKVSETEANAYATKQSLIALDDLKNKRSVWEILRTIESSKPGSSDLLNPVIVEGKAVIQKAQKGTEPGQYPEVAILALQEIIIRAEGIANESSSSQKLIDGVKTELEEAVKIFKKSGVPIVAAKKAYLRVEGVNDTIFDGEVTVNASAEQAQTALDVLEQGLMTKAIPYELKSSSYGAYVSSISGETMAKYGGYDGWNYLVNNVLADVGIGSYKVQSGDHLVFYYGGMDTYLPRVEVLENTHIIGMPWQVKISTSYDEWNADWTSKTTKTKVISDAVVTFEGKTYKSDQNGIATMDSPSVVGAYSLLVSKDRVGNYPELVRQKNEAVIFSTPEKEEMGKVHKKEIKKNQPMNLTISKNTAESKLVVEREKEAEQMVATLPYIEVKMESTGTGISEMSVVFPNNTKVSGPSDWNGEISLPKIIQASELGTFSGTLSQAIEIGLPGKTLTFDKPVRLLLPGQGIKKVGFIGTDAIFKEITTVLSADSYEEASKLPLNGEGKIAIGNDLVIWTKHFTKFVAYDEVTTGGGSTGGVIDGPTGGTVTPPVTPPIIQPSTQDISINLSIIGKNHESLFSGNLILNDQNKYKKTAMGALNQSGISYVLSSNYTDFVTSIGGQANKGMTGWMYKVNGVAPAVLASQSQLKSGDKVEWFFSSSDTTPIGGSSSGSTTVTPAVAVTAQTVASQAGIFKEDVHTDGDKLLQEALTLTKGGTPTLTVESFKDGEVSVSLKNILALGNKETDLKLKNKLVSLTIAHESLKVLGSAAGKLPLDQMRIGMTEVSEEWDRMIAAVIDFKEGTLSQVPVKTLDFSAAIVSKNTKGDSLSEKITVFNEPVLVEFDLSALKLTSAEIKVLTGVRYFKKSDGSIGVSKLGGQYNSKTKVFSFLTDSFGSYGIVTAKVLTQIEVKVGEKAYTVNGSDASFDQIPFIKDGRTYVPVAAIAKALGGKVVWDEKAKTVSIIVDQKTATYTFTKTGSGKESLAMISNGRTYVPVADLSQLLSANVLWIPSAKRVLVVK